MIEKFLQNAIAAAIKAAKKAVPGETEKGVALAPSTKDLKPSNNSDKTEEVEDERRFAPVHILLCVY